MKEPALQSSEKETGKERIGEEGGGHRCSGWLLYSADCGRSQSHLLVVS